MIRVKIKVNVSGKYSPSHVIWMYNEIWWVNETFMYLRVFSKVLSQFSSSYSSSWDWSSPLQIVNWNHNSSWRVLWSPQIQSLEFFEASINQRKIHINYAQWCSVEKKKKGISQLYSSIYSSLSCIGMLIWYATVVKCMLGCKDGNGGRWEWEPIFTSLPCFYPQLISVLG